MDPHFAILETVNYCANGPPPPPSPSSIQEKLQEKLSEQEKEKLEKQKSLKEVSSLIWRSEDPPATITTCTGGYRISILYS